MDSDRPRLLVLASTFPRWAGDTEPRFVERLSYELAGSFDVVVLAPHTRGAKRQETMASNGRSIEVRRFRYFPERFETLAYDGGMLSRVRRNPLRLLVLPFFLVPLSASCLVLSLSGPPFVLYVVMVFLGIAYGASSTLFGSLWPGIYGTAYLGSIRAVTVSAVVIATAAGPGLTGTLIDKGITLPRQMFYLAIYCLAATVAMGVAAVCLRRRAVG